MHPRGRPKKYRIVEKAPRICQFSPRGKPGRPDEVDLATDCFEALRLADYQGLSQIEAAKRMRISQQTFSRILKKARKVVSEAVTEGKIIRIQGGNYTISSGHNLTVKVNPRAESKTYQNTRKGSALEAQS